MEENKINKIKNWFKDPNNISLLGIIIFAIILRFYYFWITKNQPIWWDEAEYLSQAKTYAGKAFYQLTAIRLPFFPILLSIFFFLGIESEPIIRYIILFIPSIILILITYFLINKMYSDKKMALISTIILTILWEHCFYSNRFHTENLALIFQFSAIFITFLMFNKKDIKLSHKFKYLFLILVLSFLSVLSRPGNLFFIPPLILFILLYFIFSSNLSEKNKEYSVWLILILIISAVFFGLPLLSKFPMLANYYHPDWAIGWNSLNAFNGMFLSNTFLGHIFLISFYLGLILSLFNLLLSWGNFKKLFLFKKEFSSDTFNIFLIFSVLFSMIFILRANSFEYRWFFPLLPAMLSFTSKGAIFFISLVSKYTSKKLFLFFLIIFILIGSYPQIIHSTNIIKLKIDSYSPVRDSGIWIKENSEIDDLILSVSLTQHSYYTERKVKTLNDFSNEEELSKFIEEFNPKYLVVSIFEQHNSWIYSYPEKNKEKLLPLKIYELETNEGKKPGLIIYQIIN